MTLYASKADAKRKIQALIDTNDRAVARAILAVYEYQTASEQSFGSTTDANGVGFSGVDAERLKRGYSLTEKQLPYARKKIRKYWNQLRYIAECKFQLAEKQRFIDEARAAGLDP
jgi:hypothetical protein